MSLLIPDHSIIGSAAGTVPNGLLTGLVSYWKLDDLSGNAIDSHGSNDGTVVGATQGATGKIGTAYSFDGVDDFVNIDTAVDDLASTTTGTWTAWVKPVDATPLNNDWIIAFGGNPRLGIFMQDTGKFGGIFVQSGTKWFLETDNAVFSDNTWTHIAIVHNETEPVLYVDGQKPAQTFIDSTDKTAWFFDININDESMIGNLDLTGEYEWNGLIDEVGIWGRDLSADDIKSIHDNLWTYEDFN